MGGEHPNAKPRCGARLPSLHEQTDGAEPSGQSAWKWSLALRALGRRGVPGFEGQGNSFANPGSISTSVLPEISQNLPTPSRAAGKGIFRGRGLPTDHGQVTWVFPT